MRNPYQNFFNKLNSRIINNKILNFWEMAIGTPGDGVNAQKAILFSRYPTPEVLSEAR